MSHITTRHNSEDDFEHVPAMTPIVDRNNDDFELIDMPPTRQSIILPSPVVINSPQKRKTNNDACHYPKLAGSTENTANLPLSILQAQSPHNSKNIQNKDLPDSFDLSKPISTAWIEKEYLSLLRTPYDACLCSAPCFCVLLEYIRAGDWFLLHLHLIYYQAHHTTLLSHNFKPPPPPDQSLSNSNTGEVLENDTAITYNLEDIINSLDLLSATPNFSASFNTNSINKVKPIGKTIIDPKNKHTLYNNFYQIQNSSQYSQLNASNVNLYDIPSQHQDNMNDDPLYPPGISQHHSNDNYDPFDSLYDEDDNTTRDYDNHYVVKNFQEDFTMIKDKFTNPNKHLFNIHPKSFGSILHQYDIVALQQFLINQLNISPTFSQCNNNPQQELQPQITLDNSYNPYHITTKRTLRQNYLDIIPANKYLQSNTANALKVYSNNLPPLALACLLQQFKCIDVLIYHGASINSTSHIPIFTTNSLHHPRMRFNVVDFAIMAIFSGKTVCNDFTPLIYVLTQLKPDVLTWTIDHNGNNIFQRLLLSYNPYAKSVSKRFPLPPGFKTYLEYVMFLLMYNATWYDPYHTNNFGQSVIILLQEQYSRKSNPNTPVDDISDDDANQELSRLMAMLNPSVSHQFLLTKNHPPGSIKIDHAPAYFTTFSPINDPNYVTSATTPLKRRFCELGHFFHLFLPPPVLQLQYLPHLSENDTDLESARFSIITDSSVVSPIKAWLFTKFFKTVNMKVYQPTPGSLPSKVNSIATPILNEGNTHGHYIQDNGDDQHELNIHSFFDSHTEINDLIAIEKLKKNVKQVKFDPYNILYDEDDDYISPTTSKTILMILIEDDQHDIQLLTTLQKQSLMLYERLQFEFVYLYKRFTLQINNKGNISPYNPLEGSQTSILLLMTIYNIFLIQLRLQKRVLLVDAMLSARRHAIFNYNGTSSNYASPFSSAAQFAQLRFELTNFTRLDHRDMIGFGAWDILSSQFNNKHIFDMVTTAYMSYPTHNYHNNIKLFYKIVSKTKPNTLRNTKQAVDPPKPKDNEQLLLLLPNQYDETSVDLAIYNNDVIKQQIIFTLNIFQSLNRASVVEVAADYAQKNKIRRAPRLSLASIERATQLAVKTYAYHKVKRCSFMQRKYKYLRRSLHLIKATMIQKRKEIKKKKRSVNTTSGGGFFSKLFGGGDDKKSTPIVNQDDNDENDDDLLDKTIDIELEYKFHNNTNEFNEKKSDEYTTYNPKLIYTALLALPYMFRHMKHHYTLMDILRSIVNPSNSLEQQCHEQEQQQKFEFSDLDTSSLLYEFKWYKITRPISTILYPTLYERPANSLHTFHLTYNIDLIQFISSKYNTYQTLSSLPYNMCSIGHEWINSQSNPRIFNKIGDINAHISSLLINNTQNTPLNNSLNNVPSNSKDIVNDVTLNESVIYNNVLSYISRINIRTQILQDIDINVYCNMNEKQPIDVMSFYDYLLTILLDSFQQQQGTGPHNNLDHLIIPSPHKSRTIFQILLHLFPNTKSLIHHHTQSLNAAMSSNLPQNSSLLLLAAQQLQQNQKVKSDLYLDVDVFISNHNFFTQSNPSTGHDGSHTTSITSQHKMFSKDVVQQFKAYLEKNALLKYTLITYRNGDDIQRRILLLERFFAIFVHNSNELCWDDFTRRQQYYQSINAQLDHVVTNTIQLPLATRDQIHLSQYSSTYDNPGDNTFVFNRDPINQENIARSRADNPDFGVILEDDDNAQKRELEKQTSDLMLLHAVDISADTNLDQVEFHQYQQKLTHQYKNEINGVIKTSKNELNSPQKQVVDKFQHLHTNSSYYLELIKVLFAQNNNQTLTINRASNNSSNVYTSRFHLYCLFLAIRSIYKQDVVALFIIREKYNQTLKHLQQLQFDTAKNSNIPSSSLLSSAVKKYQQSSHQKNTQNQMHLGLSANVPLLIYSIQNYLLGSTHALLLLDSSPNDFVETTIQPTNPNTATAMRSLITIQMTAIQTAVRAFYTISQHNPSHMTTTSNTNACILTTKLLLQFGAYPYPELINEITSSSGINHAYNSGQKPFITLYQLIFSRQELPSLSLVQLIDAIDYHHIDAPTGLKCDIASAKIQSEKEIHPMLSAYGDVVNNKMTITSGFTVMHIACRHRFTAQYPLNTLKFLTHLNHASFHVQDEETGTTPMMCLVTSQGNDQAVDFILRNVGQSSIFMEIKYNPNMVLYDLYDVFDESLLKSRFNNSIPWYYDGESAFIPIVNTKCLSVIDLALPEYKLLIFKYLNVWKKGSQDCPAIDQASN